MQFKEVQIEVPWGHVSGKWYGLEKVRPILMLHGWQDNAGTFDTLIPLLPSHLSYLAIDLPGHGLSSRLPHGIRYTQINYILVLNIIRQHYNWDCLSLCSHSMGAGVSTLYAALYPGRCDLLIALDGIMRPYEGKVNTHIQLLQMYGDEFLQLDKMNRSGVEPPTYTYDDILSRWSKQSKISIEGVKYLTKRGIMESKKNPNQFYFSRDVRLKLMDFGRSSFSDEIHYKIVERITAPHLYLNANRYSSYAGSEGVHRAINILKATNPKFQWFDIDGSHHCHLTEPHLVSEHISNFINKYRPATTTDTKHKL